MTKVGWQPGGAALLVNCECHSTLIAERMADVCLCRTCRRLITGADGDVKVCVLGEFGPLVLCMACFRRDPRRARWLEWDKAFGREGDAGRVCVAGRRKARVGGGSK
jgi:hypothetical protein